MSARRQLGDENLPATAPNPHLFRLTDKEKENVNIYTQKMFIIRAFVS